jgi:hypothetical protein
MVLIQAAGLENKAFSRVVLKSCWPPRLLVDVPEDQGCEGVKGLFYALRHMQLSKMSLTYKFCLPSIAKISAARIFAPRKV